ncbi:protease HtpX [Candidatus Woesearchaeota archaeon CG10_big_fil_rev_8_21_14_0_10_33_12]|nr:MAG: protease HtpX [Candidatus Woesearchaeota archaeon CG10_big_fil_rev_8_21_14_0_10_33_12]
MKNQLKTVVLLALLTALLLWIGSFWGTSGLIIGLIFAIVLNFGSYWFSDKIVLRMYHAKQVSESEAPRLHKLVREVTQLANLPMPKVYIVPTKNPNAFATGRNPKNAAIACTEGILELLNDDELKGVIAHEASHIKNRDTLIQVVAATIAGVISYAAMMARWGAIFGGFGGRDRDGGSGMELLFLAIVTPIIATLLQLAISRSREFLADESAAKTLHNSFGLANALEKLEQGVKKNPLRFGSQATSCLFISNPFRGGLLNFFSTHPPMAERINKLKSMNL